MTRDRLVEALWGDRQPENPFAALYSQVARLREVLRAAGASNEALETKPTGYVLSAADVDSVHFESLRLRARELRAPERAADTLAEALALWSGHSYLGVEDEAVRAEAARLDELRHIAQEELAEALVAAGRAADAIPALESFITAHPLRERARGGLMRALYATGRHADALAQFNDYRRMLADELGLEPTEALRDLQGRVLSRDLDTAANPTTTARAPRYPPREPMDGVRRRATCGGCVTAMSRWGSAASPGPRRVMVRRSSRCRPGCPISRSSRRVEGRGRGCSIASARGAAS